MFLFLLAISCPLKITFWFGLPIFHKFSFFYYFPSVNLVKSKLDPESLGIILLGPFLLEFFPDQVGQVTNPGYLCMCAHVCMQGRFFL